MASARCTRCATAASERTLAAQSDVVVQNWRPGVAERLGIGYEQLRRDDLVYVSISGFGDEGPYAAKGAYDTVIQAYAGVAISQADASTGTPGFARQVLADKVTALTASQAITAALFARERGQGGQHVKLSMLDAVATFMWIDAAGNEVLRDGDGSQPGSFAANTRPIRFVDGWAVATIPTSSGCAERSAWTATTTRASPAPLCSITSTRSLARWSASATWWPSR